MMEDALNSSNYTDPEVGYRKYMDVMSFVDFQIAQELSHNVDGYRLSSKIYKRRDSVDPRFKMVLWDFNIAYGNSDYYQGWYTNTWIYENNDVLNSNGDTQLVPFWWYKLNKDPYYQNLLKNRWAQCRRSNMREDRIMEKIDSMATQLTSGGAMTRNSQAWPRWGQYVWPNYYVAQNFNDEVSHLKQWISQRLAWMDQKLGFDPNAVVVGDVNGDGEVTSVDITCIYNYLLHSDMTYYDTSDVNGDGQVTSTDITVIYNILLGN
ncbi:MAG: CotH kinase family protein [Muribaculaceae bacterium]|nr:CotH kinase family protein [Muribaculaceae bacterium]